MSLRGIAEPENNPPRTCYAINYPRKEVGYAGPGPPKRPLLWDLSKTYATDLTQ